MMNPEEKTYPSLQGCLHRKLEIRGREGRFKPIPTGPTRATYRLGPCGALVTAVTAGERVLALNSERQCAPKMGLKKR